MKQNNNFIASPRLVSLLERTAQIINQKMQDDVRDYNTNFNRHGLSGLDINRAVLKAADEHQIDLRVAEQAIEEYMSAHPWERDADDETPAG